MGKSEVSAPAGTPFVDVVREFDAPASLVYRAYTEPELVKQWLGPRKYEMTIEQWEPRDGGTYRYIHRGSDGSEFAFRGVFHTMAPENMVQTFEFEGAPGHVSLDQQTIEDLGNGRSRVVMHSVFQSVEDRDAMTQHGMVEGMNEGFDRLDELLERLAVPAGR